MFFGLGHDFVNGNVTDHDEGRVLGPVGFFEVGQNVVTGQGQGCGLGAQDVMAVAGVLLEHQAGDQLLRDGVTIVLAAPEVGQVLSPDPIQLVLREGRVPDQVGDQLQCGAPVAGHDLGGYQGRLAPGVGGDPGAEKFESGGDVLAAAAFCAAFGQHLGREAGQSGQRLGVVGCAAVKQQSHGDQGQGTPLNHHQAHAVIQLVALGNGRREFGFGGGGRHDGTVHRRGRGL